MLITLHPDNPEPRKLKMIIECLRDGGVIVYPTDTIYGLGCDITQHKAIEKICQIKNIKPEKANFSFICNDLSHISEYTLPFDTSIYKIMRRVLPGAYTFILKANNNVPKLLKSNKKTVGIRVPDNVIARAIVQELGNPLLSTSLRQFDEVLEYYTDPYEIYNDYEKIVDIVIDGGYGGNVGSTVVDCTTGEAVVLREGAGVVDWE
jgi:tRNA threonylcarbamoyl adenosine modification protein (Sua5/YciO/YrdC/YwlC family)